MRINALPGSPDHETTALPTDTSAIQEPHIIITINRISTKSGVIKYCLVHMEVDGQSLKGKDQYWKRPNFKKMKWKIFLPIMWKNMFWLIHDDNKFAGKPPTNWYIC